MRYCAFCGKSGQPMTSEHAWPVWLLEHTRPYSGAIGRLRHARERGAPVLERRGPALEVTVKRYCDSCNAGWMSDLESNMAPLLKPLMDGVRTRISKHLAGHLATWAVKTAMVFDSLRPQPKWFYLAREREGLKQLLTPPPRTYVWIGCAAGQRLFTVGGESERRPVDDNHLVWSHACQLVLMNVVFRVMTIRIQPDDRPDACPSQVKCRPNYAPIYPWTRRKGALRWPTNGPVRQREDMEQELSEFSRS